MSRKGAELSTETKELIVTLSQSVQNKSELSRLLNIPRTTITSVLGEYRRTCTVETLTRSGGKRASQIDTDILQSVWLKVTDVLPYRTLLQI